MKPSFLKNEVFRSVAVLSSASAASQLIIAAASPVLTRLYSPGDFGLLAVYMAIVSILGTVSALCYDGAIPLPKYDGAAINVLTLCLSIVTALTLVCALTLVFWGGIIASVFDVPELRDLQWLIPFGMGAMGYVFALNQWAVRKKSFATIAQTRLTQALSQTAIQLGAAFTPFAAFGLLFGSLVGQAGGITRLSAPLLGRGRSVWKAVSPRKLLIVAARYRRFPTYYLLSVVMRVINRNSPALLLAYFFGPAIAGFYLLAERIAALPSELIGNAVSQSLHRDLADARRRRVVGETVIVPVIALARLLVAPAFLGALVIPDLTAFVFGAEWRTSGLMMQWLTPWILVMLIFAPMMPLAAIMEWQRQVLVHQTISLLLGVGTMVLLARVHGPLPALAGFFLANTATAVAYRLYMLHLLRVSPWRLIAPFMKHVLIFGACFALIAIVEQMDGWMRWAGTALLGAAILCLYVFLNLRHAEGGFSPARVLRRRKSDLH